MPTRDWKEVYKACIFAHSLCDLSGFHERPYRDYPMLCEFALSMALSIGRLLQNDSVHHDQIDEILLPAFIAAAIHRPSQTTILDRRVDEIDEIVQEWRADRLEKIKQRSTNFSKETWTILRKDLRGAIPDPEALERVVESIAALMSLYETGRSFHAAWIPFANSYFATLKDRRFFITDQGHIGVGPHHLQLGNPVVILHGATVPYVFQQGNGSSFLLGPCYLEGIMERQYIQHTIDEGGKEMVETKTEFFDLAYT